MARIGHGISGWSLIAPMEIVRAASRLDRKTLAWGAIALGAILLLSINLLSSLLFKNVKADLTQDRLFTISDGTKRVLSKMDEPVNVRLYYTKKLGEVAPLYGKYFERVKALLEQYRDLSNGKLRLTLLEPQSFSDAEDRAVAAGLRGVRLNQDGETGYFGLVASNTTDNDATVEFFSPDRERFLEYDLTKLVNGLANPKKRVIGVIAGIPIDGGMGNPMQPMRQPPPAWMVMDQIREFFEVKTLQPDLKEVPGDIDVLMLAQPQGLTPEGAYAIDQFALKGGRILAFVDPLPESSPMPGMGGMSMPSPGPGEELLKLLKAWGSLLIRRRSQAIRRSHAAYSSAADGDRLSLITSAGCRSTSRRSTTRTCSPPALSV
ncbi:MAG: GldG family protein [Rhodospirillales bacterium]|nr:GldG family protein [Rhodospirillales bacterium]